jgi:hypothetical protein
MANFSAEPKLRNIGAGVASRPVWRATSRDLASKLSHLQIYKVITIKILSISHFPSIALTHKQNLPYIDQAIARFIKATNHCFNFYPLLTITVVFFQKPSVLGKMSYQG